jgi:hypothetical protein
MPKPSRWKAFRSLPGPMRGGAHLALWILLLLTLPAQADAIAKHGNDWVRITALGCGKHEYVRGNVSSNTVESSFSILKRGLIGTFHSVSEKHLQRYCNEFDFRWNTRQSQGWNDSDRAEAALLGIAGKRLTYRRIGGQQEAHI